MITALQIHPTTAGQILPWDQVGLALLQQANTELQDTPDPTLSLCEEPHKHANSLKQALRSGPPADSRRQLLPAKESRYFPGTGITHQWAGNSPSLWDPTLPTTEAMLAPVPLGS